MKQKWNNLPIVYKLFTALFAVIALIVIILWSYLWGYESNLMLKKEQDTLVAQSIVAANELNIHLDQLEKEVHFLSQLEVMNDMVTQDMDRRITKIMEQKANDLGESIVLFAIAKDATIVAASQPKLLHQVYTKTVDFHKMIKKDQKYLFSGEMLYLFTPIYASFDRNNFLGYIVMSYPLKNFALQLKTDKNFYRWLTPPNSSTVVYDVNTPMLDISDYLYHDIILEEILQGWVLHYAMPKSEALALLYYFQTLFLSGLGFGLLVIAVLIWIIVLRIIKPLRELSDTAMKILSTGDYSQTVVERGFDEVGIMARTFNLLMFTTMANMKRIEYEREEHSDKLVSLIVFFNAITGSNTQEETIEIAMNEIRRFSNAKEVYFSMNACEMDRVTIALNTIGYGNQGMICIKEPLLTKESNERFYAAMERMLTLQMERIELLEKTQAALKSKSAFLSAMSHELRTPLGSILSLTQYTMIQPTTPESILETLEKIENSAHHLLGVINNILDLAKAESGKMEAHIAACDPKQLIEDALELVSPLAEDKGLHIETMFEPYEGTFISDARLFRQVIINLLSNAIKYTQKGLIRIELYYAQGNFRLDIHDSGRGIAPEALRYLFDPFYQVGSVDPSGLKGSGLGLAISREIALLLRGDLSVVSQGEGKGTTATFQFCSF